MGRPPRAHLLVRGLHPAIPARLALRVPHTGSDDARETLEVQLGAPCGACVRGSLSAGMEPTSCAQLCGAACGAGSLPCRLPCRLPCWEIGARTEPARCEDAGLEAPAHRSSHRRTWPPRSRPPTSQAPLPSTPSRRPRSLGSVACLSGCCSRSGCPPASKRRSYPASLATSAAAGRSSAPARRRRRSPTRGAATPRAGGAFLGGEGGLLAGYWQNFVGG